jgi:hypothetical protein
MRGGVPAAKTYPGTKSNRFLFSRPVDPVDEVGHHAEASVLLGKKSFHPRYKSGVCSLSHHYKKTSFIHWFFIFIDTDEYI